MIDLWAELQPALAHPHVDEVMAKFGVTSETRLLCGGACIETHGDLFYEPVPDGRPAIILPIFDGDEIFDLLAFDPREPNRWWCRLGGEPMLGASALSNQLLGQRLHVYRNPMSWLQHDCDGIVALDFNRASIDLITAQNGLVAEDDAHVNELYQALNDAAQWRIPDIYLRRRDAA